MILGTVTEAWCYPIKSVGGTAVRAFELNSRGVVGDRVLAVYGSDGKIGSGKATRRFRRMDGLLDCSTAVDEAGTITLCTPDGETCVAPSAKADAVLSKLLGEPVKVRSEQAIAHFDVGALHLLTTSSLEWLEERLGRPMPATRFRPNLVFRAPAAPPHIENTWVGRRLHLGSAVIEVTAPTERCVMVTMPQPRLPADQRILRLLAQEREACFGVYASVVVPGTIRLGQNVEALL